MKLATFDIFDTALIRLCGSPQNVFYMLGQRLYPNDSAARDAFVHWRSHAKGETIADIYANGIERDFPEYTSEELIDAELAVEADQLTVNPAVRDIICKSRDAGCVVAFVSDMYLPSAWLAEVLKREGCLEEGERVYVSCEHGARKDTGKLYEVVSRELQPSEWRHYGDNNRSDVRMARRHGVKAHLVDTKYTDVEKRLIEQSTSYRQGWKLQALAGLQRAARLSMGNTPEAILAADFVAPTYVAYVTNILGECSRHGIKRLAFLSRDGYIMQRIADSLQPENIELGYLFVSRRSLMRPYLAGGDSKDKFLAVMDKGTLLRKRVNELLRMLSLDGGELENRYDIRFAYEQIISNEQQEDFLNKIFGNRRLADDFQEECASQRAVLLDYFKQEGITEDNVALADVGWLGTSRLMINSILRQEGYDCPLTFYLGARGDVYTPAKGAFWSYFRPGMLDTSNTALIESYFSASPWPSTAGYVLKGNKVHPVFDNGKVYSENAVVKTNVAAARYMAGRVKAISPSDDMLYNWAKQSIDWLSYLKSDIDLTPLAQTADIGGSNALVRRLGIVQLSNTVLLGKHTTDFDRGSLTYTLGRSLSHLAIPIASFTGKLRSFLFRRFIAPN